MQRKLLFTIDGIEVFGYLNNTVIAFKSKMAIDADGSPRAYHPDSVSGLDDLANAGHPGNWFGILTDNDKPDGTPVKQIATDPAPGFFISPTALSDSSKPNRRDPTRFVNAEEIPYVALPPQLLNFLHKADIGFALNDNNGKLSNFIFADVGGRSKIGEGSVKLAVNLGINPDARRGGIGSGIVYLLFAGSGDRRVKTIVEIDTISNNFKGTIDTAAILADFTATHLPAPQAPVFSDPDANLITGNQNIAAREAIISVAASQDGTKESPPNSNKTKYGKWYGLDGEKWCAIFVSWVYAHAGHPLGHIESKNGYQSCQGGFNHWKASGELTKDPQKGDIAIYDWDGDGHCDHTGIFEAWTDAAHTTFFSWEGNTDVGNNSDGGIVMRRERKASVVKAFVSPRVLGDPSSPVVNDNIQRGDRGTEVADVQRLLHDMDFTITVDGIFGPDTETAVKQFQKENNLPETGIVTTVLLGIMEEKSIQPRVADKKFTTGSFLRKGNNGAAVKALQQALNASGIMPAVISDGVFGNATLQAVKTFQRQNGLGSDGIAGPLTLKALGIQGI